MARAKASKVARVKAWSSTRARAISVYIPLMSY